MMGDTVYILSASYNGSRLMYAGGGDKLSATLRLGQAKQFPSETHARMYMIEAHETWQVQKITKKKIFEARLHGK